MPSKMEAPNIHIPLEAISQSAFSQFGHVIANPTKRRGTTADYQNIIANQGSATKYLNVTDLTNFYTLAAAKKPAKTSINIFSCMPRKLRISDPEFSSAYPKAGQKHYFDVKILERHPFTSQTFIPLGHSTSDHSTKYLVIVAPTLPASQAQRSEVERPPPYPSSAPKERMPLKQTFARSRPSPYTNNVDPPDRRADRRPDDPNAPRGPGLPDLQNAKAFIVSGDQAVTYGPGTWHAPMVVLGKRPIDFVVVQYASGVALDDCQEVELESADGEGLTVSIDGLGDELVDSGRPKAQL